MRNLLDKSLRNHRKKRDRIKAVDSLAELEVLHLSFKELSRESRSPRDELIRDLSTNCLRLFEILFPEAVEELRE